MPRIEVYEKKIINDFQVGEKVKIKGTIGKNDTKWYGEIKEINENVALVKFDKPLDATWGKNFYYEEDLESLEYVGNK